MRSRFRLSKFVQQTNRIIVEPHKLSILYSQKQKISQSPGNDEKLILTANEWREKLTHEQYRVLRNKATEFPYKGEYTSFKPTKGYFICAGCNNPLYSFQAKFESNCGWPAFDECFKNSVQTKIDDDGHRIEILCNKCDGHLGHIFVGEGFDTAGKSRSDQRHCVNSISIKYMNEDIPNHLIEDSLQIEN